MESAVTKLLVATRQLLESLQMWSVMKMTDLEVSDTYVKLGNDFNNAVGAFVQNGVSMDDLLSVPQDLRECLESLLALDPTPENLDIYLPRVRQVIVTLLSGLKAKQALYRRLVLGVPSSSSGSGDTRHTTSTRSGRQEIPFRNPFEHVQTDESAARSYSGYSLNSQDSASTHGGRRSPDPTKRYSNLQQQRQSGRPTRPELPLPNQMISAPASTTQSDRHLSTASNGTTRNRIAAPLPPAPPDAFRPPRRRVTPTDPMTTTRRGSVTPAPTPVPTPTPPMMYEPVFEHPQEAPSIPARAVERERFALRDDPASSTMNGSPPSAARRQSRALPSRPGEPPAAPHTAPGDTNGPVTPPRRQSHVTKRNSGGSVHGSTGSGHRRTTSDPDRGEEERNNGLGSRFSLDSEVTETPTVRKRTLGEDTGRLLPPLSDLPSLEEGLSVDTTSKVRPPAATSIPAPAPPAQGTQESPAALASLTALQNSEALGRRASKRFSQYQYKQLLPGHHKGPSSSSMRHGRMDSLVEGASSTDGVGLSAAVPGAQSPVRPARRVVTGTEGETDIPPVPRLPEQLRQPRAGEVVGGEQGKRERVAEPRMSIPTIITPDSETIAPPEPSPGPDAEVAESLSTPIPDQRAPFTFRVFLQYGRETKKIVLDRREVTSIADLQGLFMTKFEYAPEGREMFPDVYLKDPVTGIAYHLEDMDDVKPDVLLSLNIDQLDQVKQHFDNTISGLLHEIKELKNNVAQNRRLSAYKPEHSTLSPSMHPADRPSARSPAKVFTLSRPSSPVPAVVALPDTTPAVAPNLHAQLDDVQSLRRELGIMRQQYVDFVNQSKTAFSTIRDQTQTMREISTTKLSGSRSLLNTGKSALEKDSSEVVRAVEEVSDAIDNVKDDVVRRQILPPPNRMETMRKNLDEAKAHVEKLKQQVSLVAPAWKATWNEELSTVLEEQRLLKYHESLASDLEGDITQASGIFATLQQYMAQRQQGLGMTRRQFRQPTRAAETTVPNLLLEIRTQEADPNRRLRAIEEQQKAREREKAAKQDDEFSAELTGFVAGRKLKKTGGTEEAERLRMRKQEQSFKKMFNDKRDKQGGEAPSPVTPATPATPSTAMSETGPSSAPDSPAAPQEELEADGSGKDQSA